MLKILLPILAASMIGWGAWATIGIDSSVKRQEFTEHQRQNDSRYAELLKEIQRQRESIEEKLDDIQKSLPRRNN